MAVGIAYDKNAEKSFEPIPDGLYTLQVDKAEYLKAKADKKEMFKVVFSVTSGPEGSAELDKYRNRKIFENYVVGINWRINFLVKCAKACGIEERFFSDFDHNIGMMNGKLLKARITHEKRKDNGQIINKVDGDNYLPHDGAATAGNLPFNGPATLPAGGTPAAALPFNV